MTATKARFSARVGAASVVALLALSACGGEAEGPSDQDARDAGREYGQTLRETVGDDISTEQLEDMCGQGAREEGIVDEGDRQADAFIDGCLEAVSGE